MLASKSDDHVKMYKFFVRRFSIIKIKAYKKGFRRLVRLPTGRTLILEIIQRDGNQLIK